MSKESGKDKKTWKVKVAKQFKKMHGSSQAAHSSSAAASVEGASIGVPLEDCPTDEFDKIPVLIKILVTIVEEKGLEIVGVYRVPGNSAAVANLTEQVNRGIESINMDEPRWGDVNVVSSLLKSFFRKLPDPLFTGDLYPVFIEASKIEDPSSRLSTLKRLAHNLPEANFETLKYVCNHLCKVMQNSEVNKMEVRNLAIVFGPTLVRTADDNMLAMVTDMSQQCRIIESILNNCEWFFDEEGVGDIPIPNLLEGKQASISQTGNQSLLLHNLQKLEEAGKVQSPGREVSAKELVTGIISAANRKMHRNKNAVVATKKDSADGGLLSTSAIVGSASRLEAPTKPSQGTR